VGGFFTKIDKILQYGWGIVLWGEGVLRSAKGGYGVGGVNTSKIWKDYKAKKYNISMDKG